MRSPGIWLRWSWRDLKARWPQVLAIALVIALGTGSYSGLSSVTRWRQQSSDAAYDHLKMHDLRVQVAQEGTLPAGTLLKIVESLPEPKLVTAAEERLSIDIQVDASRNGETIVVPGRLYGMTIPSPTGIDSLHVTHGRALEAADAGQQRVVL